MSGQTNARPSSFPRDGAHLIGKFRPIEGGKSARIRSGWHDPVRARVTLSMWGPMPRALNRPFGNSSADATVRPWLGHAGRDGIDVQGTTPLTPHSYIPYAPPYVTNYSVSRIWSWPPRCEGQSWFFRALRFRGLRSWAKTTGACRCSSDTQAGVIWLACQPIATCMKPTGGPFGSAAASLSRMKQSSSRGRRNLAAATAAPPDETS